MTELLIYLKVDNIYLLQLVRDIGQFASVQKIVGEHLVIFSLFGFLEGNSRESLRNGEGIHGIWI